jgi:hypothetical protein
MSEHNRTPRTIELHALATITGGSSTRTDIPQNHKLDCHRPQTVGDRLACRNHGKPDTEAGKKAQAAKDKWELFHNTIGALKSVLGRR